MARFGEVVGCTGITTPKGLPVTSLCRQAIGAKPPKQDIVGASMFGVQLQTVALEELAGDRAPLDLHARLGGDRVAKDRQAAVFVPIRKNPATDLVPCLGKLAAWPAIGVRRRAIVIALAPLL